MKRITRLSLAALVALGSTSAYAETKISGNSKMYYETYQGNGNDNSGYTNASNEFVTNISLKQTNSEGVSFNLKATGYSTLGATSGIASSGRVGTTDTGSFIGEAYTVVPMAGKNTVVAGYMPLNTPFAFTENWNAVSNTFGAVVVKNEAIDGLTFLGAYVGQHNSKFVKVVDVKDGFQTLGNDGAYMAAVNSKMLNAYYYKVSGIADAIWVDANVAGAKLTVANITSATAGTDATTGVAASYGLKAGVAKVSFAGSYVLDGSMALSNLATTKKTKLPTAGIYTDGAYVAQPNTMAVKVKAVAPVAGMKLITQFVYSDTTKNKTGATDTSKDTTELDVIAVKKFGSITVKPIYMLRMGNDTDKVSSLNAGAGTMQHRFRVIASASF